MDKDLKNLISIYIIPIKYENGIPIFGTPIRKDKWLRKKKLKKIKKIINKSE